MDLIYNKRILAIAYYLPQFHRLQFNDDYWGKGYTEWTNTAKCKPLFKNHYQPHIPADLGFYDLTVPSIRQEQVNLAKEYGIDSFCYWHYWFGKNDEVMERPFDDFVKDKACQFSFCLAWANHDWHNVKTKEIIIKQRYEGQEDYVAHYHRLRDAFMDKRYTSISGRLIFCIYDPFSIPNFNIFKSIWNTEAQKDGLKGFYYIAIIKTDEEIDRAFQMGYDAVNIIRLHEFENHRSIWNKRIKNFFNRYLGTPYKFEFNKVSKYFIMDRDKEEQIIPTIISGWDHSPRSGSKALILDKFSPDSFYKHALIAFDCIHKKKNPVVFIRAWNEWAEGNHLEPDLKYGLGYLKSFKKAREKYE